MSEHSHLPREGSELTRRTVLAGVAASTVAAGVAGMELPAQAQTPDPTRMEDMLAFIYLSSALTGIAEDRLAPGFALPPPKDQPDPLKKNQGSDPVDIKRDYFALLLQPDVRETFAKLLQIAKDNVSAPDRAAAIIQKVQASDDTRYLGRSIVLMWYLGAWYDPRELQKSSANPAGPPPDFKVISPKAYTQGWVLSVAQAHPMGFSQFQFGYWSRPPRDLVNFIG